MMKIDLKRTGNVKRKFLSLLLTAAMVLALLPVTAIPVSAAIITDSATTPNYSFNTDTGVLTIFTNGGTAYDEEDGFEETNWKYDSDGENGPDSGIALDDVVTVIVEEGATVLGKQAFTFCGSITTISLPSTLTTIGDYAISNTYNPDLTAITVAAGNTDFAGVDGVLYEKTDGEITTLKFCPKSISGEITIPATVTTITDGELVYSKTSLTAVNVAADNANYASSQGILYEKTDGVITTLKFCPPGKTGAVTIPDGVTAIAGNSMQVTGVTSVTIPASVESIGAYAFNSSAQLEALYFKGAVPEVAATAFNNLTKSNITVYYPYDEEGFDTEFIGFNLVRVCEVADNGEFDAALSEFSGGNVDMIRLTADVTYTSPVAIEGQTLIIDTNSYTLDVNADGAEAVLSIDNDEEPGVLTHVGEGEINVTGEDSLMAVYVGEDCSAEFTGSVTATSNLAAELGIISCAVYASGGEITVTGNVSAEGDGMRAIAADDATVTISGIVSVDGSSFDNGGDDIYPYTVYAEGSSTVTVTGNVTATGDDIAAVLAEGDEEDEDFPTVTINGNVTATPVSEEGYADGIYSYEGATVTVNGNVTASGEEASGAYANYNATVTVNGNVAASGDGVAAVAAYGYSEVTVTGNVTAEGVWSYAIDAEGGEITVNGSVTATGEAVRAVSTDGEGDETVTVTGSVSVSGDESYAVRAWSGEIEIGGGVTATGEDACAVFAAYGAIVAVDEAVSAPVAIAFADSEAVDAPISLDAGELLAEGLFTGYFKYMDDEYGAIVYIKGWTFTLGAPANGAITANDSVSEGAIDTFPGGLAISLAATADSGYVFDGWTKNVNGGSFANAAAASTTFTMPGANVTVTASFAVPRRGGGGGGSATPPAPTGGQKLEIPANFLTNPEAGGTVTLNSNVGSVTVSSNMLAVIPGAEGKKAEIVIGQGNKEDLPDDVKDAIGDRPLISLTLTLDGQQTDWSNPDAPVTVSIPYTPTAEELANPESIVVWYIDGSGNVVSVPNGRYDPVTGKVTVDVTHFSDYAVVYNPVSFSDVPAGAWYGKAVSFIASREITTGTGNGNFSPNVKLTRGQFIVMMTRTYDVSSDEISDNSALERQITRQEMFTMLYRALKAVGQLPEGNSGKTLADFSDAGQIASWAKDAMTLMVDTGTVTGSNGTLTPLSTTTRAEMAQVLYNLLSK